MPKNSSRSDGFRWAPLLWCLLILNVVVGLLYSKLTVIRKVRIEGAYSWDQDRLTRVARSLKGIPCAQINPNAVGGMVMADPDVYDTSLARNLFGSAVIKVSYRNPIAELADTPGVGVTAEGVAYRSDHLPQGLAKIKLPQSDEGPNLTIAGPLPLSALARLVAQSEEIANNKPLIVEVGDGREVCLNIGSGRVRLGSSDGLDAKMNMLKDQLRKDPDLLSKVSELNLTVPTAPTLKKLVKRS